MAELLKVTGLWEGQDRNGNKTLSGNMGGVRVVIFTNTYKEAGDNKPDMEMYFTKNEPKEGAGG